MANRAEHRRTRRPLATCFLAMSIALAAAWGVYLAFHAVRAVAIDFQVFSRWEHHTVAADEATIDNTILPAIEAYARREGRLPASLDDLVAAGDLAYVPESQAGEWFFTVRAAAFTIGVGDPPHRYPSAYRVVELEGPANPDPIGWRVRDWYHDS